MRLAVWYPLRWLAQSLPPKQGLELVSLLGDAHFLASKGKRAALERNLDRLIPGLGQAEIDRAVRDYLRTHYQSQLIIFVIPNLTRENLGQIVEFEGLEHLEAARAAGQGVVLIHGHFGPVHLPLAALGVLGYPMQQIGYPSDEGLSFIGRNVSFRLRLAYEAKIPAEIIKAGEDMRPVFKALRASGVVMITGDGTGTQARFGKHIRLGFFGQPADFPLGPASLSLRTKSAYMPMFIEPGQAAPFRIRIHEPLCPPPGEPEPELWLTKAFVALYERQVAAHPGLMHFLDRCEPGKFLAQTEEQPA